MSESERDSEKQAARTRRNRNRNRKEAKAQNKKQIKTKTTEEWMTTTKQTRRRAARERIERTEYTVTKAKTRQRTPNQRSNMRMK